MKVENFCVRRHSSFIFTWLVSLSLVLAMLGVVRASDAQWSPPAQPRSIEVVTSIAQAEADELISLLISPQNLTKEGVKTFAVARALYREGYFVECQQMLKNFWNIYPRNSSAWPQQIENVGFKLGYPCTYPALVMLAEAVNWRIKSQNLATPVVATDWNVVALIPEGGSGNMPSNDTEAAAGTGTPVSKTIEPELLANDYAILHEVMWIIREYYLAMTKGKIHLRLIVQQMPGVNFSLRHSSGTGDRNADWGKLRPAIPPEIFQKADLFWLVYPTIFPPEGSSSPYSISWYGPGTSSGGMGVFPSSYTPMLMGEDVAMTHRPMSDGHRAVHPLARQIYIPYWVQHEFFHDHYRSNKQLGLEVESHQWFDRSKWPADFVGTFEPDYYDESMMKRLQDQAEPSGAGFFITRCAPLFSPQVTEEEVIGQYEVSSPVNNWNYGEIKKVNGQLKWVNRAGVSWDLTLQPGGYFETGSGNPYRIYGATTFDPFPVRPADGLPTQKTMCGFRFGVDKFLRKPFVPSKLTATASTGGVDLDWSDNRDSEFSSYRIYRSTTSGSYGAPMVAGLTNSQYLDTTVVNGTTYYYTVTSCNTNSSESPLVNEVSFTPRPITEIAVQATDNSFAYYGNGVQTVTETLGIKRDTWTSVSRFAYLRFPVVSDGEIGGVPVNQIASVTLDVQVTTNQASDTLNVYALMDRVQAANNYLTESSWTGGANGVGGNLQSGNRPDGPFSVSNGCTTVKLGSYTFTAGADIGVKSIPITEMEVFRNLIKYDKNGQITLLITGSSLNLTPNLVASVFNTSGHLVPTLKLGVQSHSVVQPVPLEKARWETFSQTFTAIGGTAPYTWDEVSDEGVPPGLTLSLAGVLTGAVTSSPRTWQLVIQATDSNGAVHKVPFTLTITNGTGCLGIAQTASFGSVMPPGGPVPAATATYTLNNPGLTAINWTATGSSSWLSLSQSSGTLAAGASVNVIASINSDANSLAIGTHADTIVFSNTSNGFGNTARGVGLRVNAPPLVNAGTNRTVILNRSPWTPAFINPVAWYDAVDTATITQSGGSVSEWRSKLGTNHMLQTALAKQPQTDTSLINGLNAIKFDGTDDGLKTAVNPFGNYVEDAMFMGVINIGTLSASTLFSLTGSSADAGKRWQSHAPYSDGNIYYDVRGASGDSRVQVASGWSANQNKLLGFYASKADNVQQIWESGTLKAGDTSGINVLTHSGIALGYDGLGSYDNCTMGEVIIVNGTVNNVNRQVLEGYLAHKWGLASSLPANHPYKLAPLSDGIVVDLSGVTSSDPDDDPLTYAWSVVSAPADVIIRDPKSPNTSLYSVYSGSYTLRLTVSDGYSQTSSDIVVTITVVSPPVANVQSVLMSKNTAQAITLTGSDADGDALTYALVAQPAHGTVSGTAPNLTYTPAPNFSGNDAFTFKVNDGKLDSSTATVSIIVLSEVSIVAEADSYVRGGAYGGNNYGTDTALDTKNQGIDNDFTRNVYIRFDLSTLPPDIAFAKIRLYDSLVNTTAGLRGVQVVTNDTWSEMSITYDNAPAPTGPDMAAWQPVVSNTVELDLTAAVQQQLAGDKKLSLYIYARDNTGGSGNARMASRETVMAEQRPALLVGIIDTTGAVITASHSVPYSWLEGINTAWTNDYEAAATNDVDADGFKTWQEYWSGTDPMDSNSFLRIDSVVLNGTNIILRWQHARVDSGLPPIAIQTRTNLLAGAWGDVVFYTPTNGVNLWSTGASAQGFYRLSVTNAP